VGRYTADVPDEDLDLDLPEPDLDEALRAPVEPPEDFAVELRLYAMFCAVRRAHLAIFGVDPSPPEARTAAAGPPAPHVWLDRRRTGPLMDGPDAAFPAAGNLTSQNTLL
jgi:hypothetical protein